MFSFETRNSSDVSRSCILVCERAGLVMFSRFKAIEKETYIARLLRSCEPATSFNSPYITKSSRALSVAIFFRSKDDLDSYSIEAYLNHLIVTQKYELY